MSAVAPRPDVALHRSETSRRAKGDLSGCNSIIEICWPTALVRARIAITPASAASDAFVWRGRIVSRDSGAGTWKPLVHVSAAFAQRFTWNEGYKNQQQRQIEKESMSRVCGS